MHYAILLPDARHFGMLDNWSAFPFENHMGKMKKLLRKPQYPFKQLSNRLAEQTNLKKLKSPPSSATHFHAEHNYGTLLPHCHGPQFIKVVLPGNVVFDTGKRKVV